MSICQKIKFVKNGGCCCISVYFFPCLTNRCDRDYGGAHCVPMAPLPFVLREDFNKNLDTVIWPEIYGAERGMLSGEPLKSGTALIFKGVSNLFTLFSAYLLPTS